MVMKDFVRSQTPSISPFRQRFCLHSDSSFHILLQTNGLPRPVMSLTLTRAIPRRKAKKKMQRGASEKKKKGGAVLELSKGSEVEVEAAPAQPKQVTLAQVHHLLF